MPAVSVHALLPDPDALLLLAPEELAGVVLQHLNSLAGPDQGDFSLPQLNRANFSRDAVQEYPKEYRDRISKALMEAWVWLEREGLLAPHPASQGVWVFVTRRGKQIATPADLAHYRRSNLLPRQLLHPRIGQKVWATFLRGSYDTAVFEAFKEVEVRVREAGGFSNNDLGTALMRKAFAPGKGALADLAAHVDEQEALAHLFAGAIGSYKNPHSHRNVTIQPEEAVEMIMLASHLLGIVDRRASGPAPAVSVAP